jgi:trimeric autotransporter adhesin
MNLFRLKSGNSTNHKFNERALLLVALVLICFGLSPAARAVLPAPDGGYLGANTAEGDSALFSLPIPFAFGSGNTALGFSALFSNTFGNNNTATGSLALRSNTTGSTNTATGVEALFSNTTGDLNTATGFDALSSNSTGSNNTASGSRALHLNSTGSENTATGLNALFSNTTGANNTATGVNALGSNTTGFGNTANGLQALPSNTTGSDNTATGSGALFNNTTGGNNTANGLLALFSNTTGSDNIALGFQAGLNLTTGDNNIDIGNEGVTGESNTIRIGRRPSRLFPQGQTATFIAGISGAAVAGPVVHINGSGQLGVPPSSARFKQNIKPMDKASEAILALKPVTFRYKQEIDQDGTPQFGLVAEDVEKAHPDLVARDNNWKVYTVRYEAVNAMLLNEFLKEHRTVQGQQKEIDALKGELKQQKALIQKVSDKVELNRPAPQVAENNQ